LVTENLKKKKNYKKKYTLFKKKKLDYRYTFI